MEAFGFYTTRSSSLKAITIPEAVSLVRRDQRINEVLDVAIHDVPEAELRVPDAVIGEAVLWEVVRTDFVRAVSRANLQTAALRDTCKLLFQLHLIETCTQNTHRLLTVL